MKYTILIHLPDLGIVVDDANADGAKDMHRD
jgi:hypothetical protein